VSDFHALRHTFITNLGRHGVPLVAAQKLARHSTPVLTAARYTHIDLADQSREVQKLPRLLGTHMGQTGGISCPKTSTDGNKSAAGLPGENPRKPAAILIKTQRRGGDSNPRSGCPDSGFQDRCNRPLCHLSDETPRLCLLESTRKQGLGKLVRAIPQCDPFIPPLSFGKRGSSGSTRLVARRTAARRPIKAGFGRDKKA
jgi:Phage integrase family